MNCGCPPPRNDEYYHWAKPKPDVWHMEIAVNITVDMSQEIDDYSSVLQHTPLFMHYKGTVDFMFSVRIGHHVTASRTIRFEERASSAFEAVQHAFENVMVKYGHAGDTFWQLRSSEPHCPVHYSKLPVFLSIDHLPEHFREMVKQIITGQHFKMLQS